MRAENLIRMANQIAQFFAPYPEPEAVAGIRDHLARFWDPAMRRELLAMATEHQRRDAGEHPLDAGTPLGPLVLQAVLTEASANGS